MTDPINYATIPARKGHMKGLDRYTRRCKRCNSLFDAERNKHRRICQLCYVPRFPYKNNKERTQVKLNHTLIKARKLKISFIDQ